MVADKIEALQQAVRGLLGKNEAELESQLNVVRKALQAVKDAIVKQCSGKDYQELLINLHKLLMQVLAGQKAEPELATFWYHLSSGVSDLPDEKASAPVVAWSTQERLADFNSLPHDVASKALSHVMQHWSVEHNGRAESISNRLHTESIGDFKSLTIDAQGYQCHVYDAKLAKGDTTYQRSTDATTKETKVEVKLPSDYIGVVRREQYRQMAELTVLAELALLRTVHVEKTDAAFSEVLKDSPVNLKPTNPHSRNDRAYCEALQAAYKKYGFNVVNTTSAIAAANNPDVFSATVLPHGESVAYEHSVGELSPKNAVYSAAVRPVERSASSTNAAAASSYETVDATFSATIGHSNISATIGHLQLKDAT